MPLIKAFVVLLLVGVIYNVAYWVYRQPSVPARAQPAAERSRPAIPVPHNTRSPFDAPSEAMPATHPDEQPANRRDSACVGHTHCSQMHSCEDARYWLHRCGDEAQMDGDQDGIPCERQWC